MGVFLYSTTKTELGYLVITKISVFGKKVFPEPWFKA